MKAIIYLPGLGVSTASQPVEAIGHRIRKSLDINHPDESKKYTIEVRKENFGYEKNLHSNVATISEEKDGELIDIYEYSYAKELTDRFENQNLIVKTFALIWTLIFNSLKVIIGLFTGKGLSKTRKVQTLYVIAILFTMAVSGIILITSLPLFFANTIDLQNQPILKNFLYETWIGNCIRLNFEWTVGYMDYAVGLMAALFLLFPNLKNLITNLATEFICLINYFNSGQQHLSLIGKFDELLEHISEHEKKYSEVIVVSYSFGCAVALDALFPPTKVCSERVRQKIKTLVTIGCPFDFIRVYWPRYYQQRVNCCANLTNWFNVCSSLDVLSSNFRDDGLEKDGNPQFSKDIVIVPKNIFFTVTPGLELNVFNALTLLGIRAHRQYWDEAKNSSSCFNNVMEEMKKVKYSPV